MNKQGNLNEFFDVSAGSGTYAPRKRNAYSSKRLQQVVSEFRNEKANLKYPPTPKISDDSGESSSNNGMDLAKKRRKTEKAEKARTESGKSTRKTAGRSRGRGRGRAAKAAKATRTRKDTATETANDEDEDEYVGGSGDVVGFPPQLRPRPKGKLVHKGEVESESEIEDHEVPK